MFKVTGTKSLDSNAIEFIDDGVNFVGRTFENNGIQGKIEKRMFEPNEPFTITATVIGNYKYVKFQKESYYCSQNINKLTPTDLIRKWNEKIAYFFVSNIQKFVSLYDYQQAGYKLDDIKNHSIQLPTKDGKIDFEFMESFIAELEAQHIAELEAYLKATGLNNYELSSDEKKSIDNFNNIKWVEYRIGDLFEISTTASFNIDKLVSGDEYDYVTRTSFNQGVLRKTGYVNKNNINKQGTWSLGLLQMDFFYRKNPWYAGQFVRKITPKMSLNYSLKLFFTAVLNKQKQKLMSVLVRDVDSTFLNGAIQLPTKDGKIDFEYIELFITAVQKQVIKDVVIYANNKISATKKVCNSK
ncbi:Type II restriction modification system specificity subunit [Mycoplasmopsis bovigenitalium 51080]|uniref:Type II restriction modification system specificity subunit n=1 Tax=Mycoplasmopsis bovigenitalium 51080 TaxID=1188235 RepID=N9TVX4_9BACT|nr:Type II restriction modification system specificity subunit [Mycoplasmopsis bovigenitalium 51080]